MTPLRRLLLTFAGMALAYAAMAVLALPNDSRFDADEFVGRVALRPAPSP